MAQKKMTGSEFGKFGQSALRGKFRTDTEYRAHMSKIQKERWAKRNTLKHPTITKGGKQK